MLVLKVREGNTWKDLDLYGNESINFNKSVLEVQEFEKRASDFTKTFRIPGTAFNNKVMGNIFKINLEDSSFDPKQSLECAITNAGNVIIVGSLRLEKMYVNVGKVDYEVVVYSQVGSLASQTSEQTLCDLNFNEYTHDLTFDNIRDSWTLNLFDGDIVYPFIHYGYDDEDVIPDIEFTLSGYSFDNPGSALPYWYYKPAIRVNKVVEKIIESAGYEVQSNFMNTLDFNRIYMPLSFSSEFGVQTLDDISFYASLSTDDAIPAGDTNVVFDIEISDTSNQYNSFTGFYTFDREGSFSFKVEYTLSTTDCCEHEGDPYYHLYDRWSRLRNGTQTYYNERFLGYQCDVNNVSFQKDITIQVGPGNTWQVGDQIAFNFSKRVIDCNEYTITSSHSSHSDITYYECETTTNPQTLRVYAGSPATICANPAIPPVFTQHSGTIVDNGHCASIHPCDATINFLSTFLLYDTPSEPGIGSSVLISQNMNCDTSQLDFLKGIFQHYNMVVVPDVDDPTKLIIEPWNNWVNDPEVVVRDWTNFLDTGKDVVVQPLVDNDNRYVKLYDVEDDDRYNKLYQDNQNQIFGEVLFDADTQILSKVKEVETIFSPTPSDGVDGNPRFIIPHLYEQDDAGNKSPFATNPRLLYYNGLVLNTQGSYWVRDENDISYQLYTFPCMSISQYLYGSDVVDRDKRVLSWNNVNNYYSQLTGFNTANMTGSYYELYWKEYFVDIYDSDSRLVTAYFNLPFQEFIQTKLNDKIQISGLFGNTQYRINRIIDYDLMDPGKTKVELTKILQEPEPIKETRTYKLERCDTQVETIATYTSLEPLTIGSSVQTDSPTFGDICYEITGIFLSVDNYINETNTGGSFPPVLYEETYNTAGNYTWDWEYFMRGNTFELRYGTNGLPTDGDVIYTITYPPTAPFQSSGTYSFDNPLGLDIIVSVSYTSFHQEPWVLNLEIHEQATSAPITSLEIENIFEDCQECEDSKLVARTYSVMPAFNGYQDFDNGIPHGIHGVDINGVSRWPYNLQTNNPNVEVNGRHCSVDFNFSQLTPSASFPSMNERFYMDAGVGTTGTFKHGFRVDENYLSLQNVYNIKVELVYQSSTGNVVQDSHVVLTRQQLFQQGLGRDDIFYLEGQKYESFNGFYQVRMTMTWETNSYIPPAGQQIIDNGDGTFTWPDRVFSIKMFAGSTGDGITNVDPSSPFYQQWILDATYQGYSRLSLAPQIPSVYVEVETTSGPIESIQSGNYIEINNPPAGVGKYAWVISEEPTQTPTHTGTLIEFEGTMIPYNTNPIFN